MRSIRPNIRSMTLCSLFAALLAVCAWVSIPLGDVAVTLQTFGVFLALLLLGGKKGTVSILLYLLLGTVGLPVFSGFQGGIGALLNVTGGFLWGFLASALVYWALEKRGKLPAAIAGMVVCYICGCGWFYLYSDGGLGFILLRCVLPFLIPDGIKLGLAFSLSKRLSKVINIPSRT